MAKRKMNFREWWDDVGTVNVRDLIDHLQSSMTYARMLRAGQKRMGLDRARSVIAWAEQNTPGFVPDLELLMMGVPRAEEPRSMLIQPSAAFLRAQRTQARREAA